MDSGQSKLQQVSSYIILSNQPSCLNPKVDSPLFAATVAAAAPLQHNQVDPVHQPLGLSSWIAEIISNDEVFSSSMA